MTSRAITRYVVYLPPPMRTTPFDSTVTRCSREALTVDPSDGAMSGRSPAYVPTTSSRVRSTAIVAFTVSSRRSISQPAADGCSGGPSNGASVVPISQKSGHGTRKTTLPGTRIVSPVLFGIRSRGTTKCAPRLGRMSSERPRNGCEGCAAQTPLASTIALVGMWRAAPVARSSASTASITPNVPSVRIPVARTRVTATPPAASAVRVTASV